MRMPAIFVAAAILVLAAPAGAIDPEACTKVRMADGGWTDNTAQNGLAAAVLEGLGYEVDATVYAMPVILKGLENKDLDIWLDNWMPSQTAEVTPYFEKGSIANLKVNLTGAGYGPVVPSYVAASGVKDLADLGKYGPRFDKKFYGIEPGNDGNRIVQAKIDDPKTGLAGWTLVESSEQGMLSQVEKMIAKQEWVAFLAWTPHPVMGRMDIHYLTGFEADGFGGATIHTLARPDYAEQCPNVAMFFTNLAFTLDMESAVMQAILDGQDAEAAGTAWLKTHPTVLEDWLAGVAARDGSDGLASVRTYLGL